MLLALSLLFVEMKKETRISYLLTDLCVEQGYCLPELVQERLIKFPPNTAERFALTVIQADGRDVSTIDKHEYQAVLDKVEEAFNEIT